MLEENVPMQKLGSTDDIANLVLFLSSDLSNFTTGSIFISDGGQISFFIGENDIR